MYFYTTCSEMDLIFFYFLHYTLGNVLLHHVPVVLASTRCYVPRCSEYNDPLQRILAILFTKLCLFTVHHSNHWLIYRERKH